MKRTLPCLLLLSSSTVSWASDIPLLTMENGGAVSAPMSALILMTLLTLVPTFIMTMTPFLRITIVLSLVRQASGLTTVPTTKVIAAISLVLSVFIMNPVITKVNEVAITPYMEGKIQITEAIENGYKPVKTFMLAQTKKEHLEKFVEISGHQFTSKEDVSFPVLWAAFVTSEIQTALKIGFFIYLPFVMVDLLVSAITMSLGMMMVSPMIISTPVKILVFVIIDGWLNIIDSLAKSFYMVL